MRKQGARMAKTRAPVDDDLLDMDQTIALLKTTRPTFYRWLREGKIKGMKVGRQWRFYRADVDRFLKGEQPQAPLPGDLNPLIKELERKFGSESLSPPSKPESQVSSLLNLLMYGAWRMRASDIHLMYAGKRERAELRFRIDGVLHPIAEFNTRFLHPIVERLKSWAECDLHVKGRP